MKRLSPRLAVLGTLLVVALVAVAGTAIAASGGSTTSPSAFLDSLAKHLGISRAKLDDAVEAAAVDQVDALLADGRITKEEADRLKERITSGELGGFGGFGPGFHGFGGHGDGHLVGGGLTAAAGYLGLTEAELRARLADGKSLAEIAKAEGKSVDGLEQALVADTKKRLDAVVADGRLTEQQATEILARYTEHVDDLVQGVFRHHGDRSFGPPRVWGPPGQGAGLPPGTSGVVVPGWGAAA